MARYIAILAAALFVGTAARAGELDNEFGAKTTAAATKTLQAAKPVLDLGAQPVGTGATELDTETPAQSRRRGWYGGWGGGWGYGWRGGWGGWYGGYRGGWGYGWRGGWGGWYGGYRGGWCGWPRYSCYAWPTYAYYAPAFSYYSYPSYGFYSYPAWGYCW